MWECYICNEKHDPKQKKLKGSLERELKEIPWTVK